MKNFVEGHSALKGGSGIAATTRCIFQRNSMVLPSTGIERDPQLVMLFIVTGNYLIKEGKKNKLHE